MTSQSNAQSEREKVIMDLVTEAFHACRSHQSYQNKPDYHVARAEKALERILELLQRAGIDVQDLERQPTFKQYWREEMNAKSKCEICGFFTTVGFTDCGLICKQCFDKEVQLNTFNYAIDEAIKTINLIEPESMEQGFMRTKILESLYPLKKKEHKKEKSCD